ncbi:cold shock domain-containing protein [Novosphingobium sp. BL-8H]|uniref:cold shock domain-containing protein n=1 Tax=Novosphingobium sp. BL-8H TaxID=3127640 RepID=UPI003757E7F8
MSIGRVVFFSAAKGYGFIKSEDDGSEHFVHLTSVKAAGLSVLRSGQQVSYQLLVARNGKVSAVDLALLD